MRFLFVGVGVGEVRGEGVVGLTTICVVVWGVYNGASPGLSGGCTSRLWHSIWTFFYVGMVWCCLVGGCDVCMLGLFLRCCVVFG